MTKRLQNTVWACLLVIQVGPAWYQVKCDRAKPPPNGPATVEAQAKFFQDFFSVQLSPYKIEFGHVCEDPNTWEQRYESNDYQNHRTMGKVRWGDKKGGYGEHYWDLNHAGSGVSNQQTKPSDDDDGSYDAAKYETPDTFDESSEPAPALEIDDTQTYDAGLSNYDAEKASYSPFDENGRRKRHHANHKVKSNKRHADDYDGKSDKKHSYEFETEEEDDDNKESKSNKYKYQDDGNHKKDYKNHKNKYEQISEEEEEEEEEPEIKPIKKFNKIKKVKDNLNEPSKESSTKTKFESAVERLAATPQYYAPPNVQTHFVPYAQGGGLRQPYQTLSPGPRLFLEPSTGHVVDRETGQAYVLQPIHLNNFS